MLKFFKLFLITCAMSLSFNILAFASDDDYYVLKSKQLEIITEDKDDNIYENVSRKDAILFAMNIYNLFTNESITSSNKSPFFDETGPIFVKAYELGLIYKDELYFKGERLIKKEEMFFIVNRCLELSGFNLKSDNISKFELDYDVIEDTDDKVLYALKSLALNDIYNEHFFVTDYVNIFEMSKLFVKAYENFYVYDLEILDKKINIGDSLDNVIEIFGEPQRIDSSEIGAKRYIYNYDYSDFISIGIYDDEVVEIYTTSENFKLDYINYSGDIKKIVDKKFDYLNNNTYKISNYNIDIIVGYDNGSNNEIDSILIRNKNFSEKNVNYNRDLITSASLMMFDLINSKRVLNGLEPLKWNETLKEVAYEHSIDMVSNAYVSYVNLNNKYAFQRMEDAGLDFRDAAEIIITTKSNPFDSFYEIYNSIGTKSNIMNEELEEIGVGMYFSRTNMFITIDMFNM